MNSVVATPYAGAGTNEDPYHALISDVLSGAAWRDVSGNAMTAGIPATNMLVVEAELSGNQISQLKSDNRFFVLKPGPGNNGSALLNWLDSKGATGHGVTESDDEDAAIGKLKEYCRKL